MSDRNTAKDLAVTKTKTRAQSAASAQAAKTAAEKERKNPTQR